MEIGDEGFDEGTVDFVRLKTASRAWLALITTLKKTVQKIVQGTDSPSKTRKQLLQRYHANGLRDRCSLSRKFIAMKIEPIEEFTKSVR